MPEPSTVTCIGFGAKDGLCTNPAGTRWTPLWCAECDAERRDHIGAQMARINAEFEDRGNA